MAEDRTAPRHVPNPSRAAAVECPPDSAPLDSEGEALTLRAEVQALREDFDGMRDLLDRMEKHWGGRISKLEGRLEKARDRNEQYRRVLKGTLHDLKALDEED